MAGRRNRGRCFHKETKLRGELAKRKIGGKKEDAGMRRRRCYKIGSAAKLRQLCLQKVQKLGNEPTGDGRSRILGTIVLYEKGSRGGSSIYTTDRIKYGERERQARPVKESLASSE